MKFKLQAGGDAAVDPMSDSKRNPETNWVTGLGFCRVIPDTGITEIRDESGEVWKFNEAQIDRACDAVRKAMMSEFYPATPTSQIRFAAEDDGFRCMRCGYFHKGVEVPPVECEDCDQPGYDQRDYLPSWTKEAPE